MKIDSATIVVEKQTNKRTRLVWTSGTLDKQQKRIILLKTNLTHLATMTKEWSGVKKS